MTFEEVRATFPVLERKAYLNAGTFGPLARRTTDALLSEAERDAREGRCGSPFFLGALELREQVRAAIASLVEAEPGQVALLASTTDACNRVVSGLGLQAGDEVVTTNEEHFGLLGPLGVSAATVVVVPADAERVVAAVTPRTKLIALSGVLWTTGKILPAAEIRARTGVPILVDGAQSVGAVPVSFPGVDFLTVSGQKWLCGPDSTGALVVADPERLRVTGPSYLAQASYEDDGTFVPRDGAVRFESNWWSVGVTRGLLAAITARPEWAFARAAETAARCRELLGRHVEVVTPKPHATLVAFRPDGEEAGAVVERLRLRDVDVREIPRTGLVRASVGYWTSDGDLERLVEGVIDR
ncbi:MAG: aminotransferase class V-fold PLP-dependent enzyme [Gaiella sp.]